jgi:hypothetical protein
MQKTTTNSRLRKWDIYISRPIIHLLAAVLLVGFCLVIFIPYYLAYADTTITVNINDDELVIDDVLKDGTPKPFTLTTQTTTDNQLGYTLSAYASSDDIDNGNITIVKDNSGAAKDCSTTVPLSTNKLAPTEIETTTSENISATPNIVTNTYCVMVTNNNIADGTYNITIGYYLAENQPTATCQNAYRASACQVDVDPNMIPIKYTGDTTTPQWQKADINQIGDWYDYDKQKWANTVTVTAATLQTYKDAPVGTIINEDDVLGYWVYIPRYAYEVQRHSAIDAPIPAQSQFDIRFEKATDGKKTPANTCSTGTPGDGVATNHKDYRTECNINRTYPGASVASNSTTWSTHPAFTFGTQELNGLWIGKYETGTDFSCYDATPTTPANCGENVSPNNIYIKPGQSPMATKYIGAMFRMANNMGINQTVGGNTITNNTNTNTMNLAAASTHQQKNNEWGAAVYLSTSMFGVYGENNVFKGGGFTDAERKVYNNGFRNDAATTNVVHSTYDTTTTRYMTGCGPVANKSDDYNTTCNQYHTILGQTASTTGNTYGLYDTAGGTWEYVMGIRNATPSKLTYMETMPDAIYYDNYPIPPFGTQLTGSSTNEYLYNFDICNYQYCGGHSLHEVVSAQSVSSNAHLWNFDYSLSVDADYSWFLRGGSSVYAYVSGAFTVTRDNGTAHDEVSWRAVGIISI